MVRIRLRRTGAKNNPAYRIVVADQKSPRDGAFIDTIGHYLPTRQPHVVEIDETKARHWLSKGAQPSETAASLLRQKGILDAQGKIAPPGSTDPYANGATPVAAAAPVAAAPVAAPVVADIVEVAPVAAEPTEAVPAADAPAADAPAAEVA